MAWWTRDKGVQTDEKKSVPKGIWLKCEGCQTALFGPDLDENTRVCQHCDFHFALPTPQRIRLVSDPGSFHEEDVEVESADPLGFRVDSKKYRDRIRVAKKTTRAPEAYLAGS